MTLTGTELLVCSVAALVLGAALLVLGRWLWRALKRPSKPRVPWLALAVVATSIVALIDAVILWCLIEYALFGVELDAQSLRALMEAAGFWAPLASIGLMAAHSFVPFPAELIAIANGMLFGLGGGVVVTWLGAMVGAILAYELAASLGPAARRKLIPQRYQSQLDRLVGEFGTRTLLVARLIPVISFNLVNYGAGLAGVPRPTFWWTTAVGIVPITVLSVLVGSAALHLPVYLLVLGAAVLVLGMLASHLIRRWLERHQMPSAPEGGP